MWIKYVEPEDEDRDIYVDPMESEEAMEEYIERRRRAFYKEWYRYLEDACQ